MNSSDKTLRRFAFAVAVALAGIVAANRPALAEGGCGPWEPTVCQSGSYWVCIGSVCDWVVIDSYGRRMDE